MSIFGNKLQEQVVLNRLLSSERRALSQLGLTTSGLAEDSGARATGDDGLSVREDSGDAETARALDVHEK